MRKLYLDPNLQLVFCVTLMAILSVSSIIPVLPDMVRNIQGLTRANAGLVITAFTLPGVLMAPITGVLGDRLGRKKILVPALFVFGIFGVACFFATDLNTLLWLRFAQGLGAGPLGMINLTIIGDLYEGRERMAAMGYNSSVLAVGTAAYPALGGLLALLGWNWPFLLPALALPLGVVVALRLDAPEPQSTGKLGTYLRDAPARPALTPYSGPVLRDPADLHPALRPDHHLPAVAPGPQVRHSGPSHRPDHIFFLAGHCPGRLEAGATLCPVFDAHPAGLRLCLLHRVHAAHSPHARRVVDRTASALLRNGPGTEHPHGHDHPQQPRPPWSNAPCSWLQTA